jgi:sortase A
MRKTRVAHTGAVLLTLGGLSLLGEQAYLAAKAAVARALITRAFAAHLADGAVHPPWPWADHHPLAELCVDRLGVRRHVLAGASGSSLAFGVGHVDGTTPPGQSGNCALAGHRNTVFRFLQELIVGDTVRLVTARGERRFLVADCLVVTRETSSPLDSTSGDRLTLITCYPFDALRSGPMRYVVICLPLPAVD